MSSDSTSDVYVYLIQAETTLMYKIGVARSPTRRCQALQTGSPLPLLVVWATPGDAQLEAFLHAVFKACRQHGEWFDFTSFLDPVEAVRSAAVAYGLMPDELRAPLDIVTSASGRWAETGQAAAAVGVDPSTLNRYVRAGRLTPTRKTLGGHNRWLVEDLEQQLAELESSELPG